MAKILIIEDNVQNMKLAAFLLNSAGHTVIQANHALGGIAIAQQHQPDLILMDIQLPGMDGLTATRLLKSDPVTQDIKIYALTALAMKGDEDKVYAAGCDGYIAKPIRYQAFLETVVTALSEAAPQKQQRGSNERAP
jgi:two-component system cell cycle response regulator DivK